MLVVLFEIRRSRRGSSRAPGRRAVPWNHAGLIAVRGVVALQNDEHRKHPRRGEYLRVTRIARIISRY